MNKFELVNNKSNDNYHSTHSHVQEHLWVTIVNPTNHRLLLQACDRCGVVKSENSILRACKAPENQQLIRDLMSVGVQQVG